MVSGRSNTKRKTRDARKEASIEPMYSESPSQQRRGPNSRRGRVRPARCGTTGFRGDAYLGHQPTMLGQSLYLQPENFRCSGGRDLVVGKRETKRNTKVVDNHAVASERNAVSNAPSPASAPPKLLIFARASTHHLVHRLHSSIPHLCCHRWMDRTRPRRAQVQAAEAADHPARWPSSQARTARPRADCISSSYSSR